jgi:hypothetical protein
LWVLILLRCTQMSLIHEERFFYQYSQVAMSISKGWGRYLLNIKLDLFRCWCTFSRKEYFFKREPILIFIFFSNFQTGLFLKEFYNFFIHLFALLSLFVYFLLPCLKLPIKNLSSPQWGASFFHKINSLTLAGRML